ncbi:MerR family DNA-binding transcriptional regulator [Geminicoccaceae bacterium 1502E]|uniref:MerR family DNA-binding transcriptional regulator n=1 Tax=Marinimicrococcus flavescens TaxID=3031815 RepID=A0AAP4D6U0_9PROT|nr:MerR family DNA-binding transcriptional regulator [Marinimicrococcus flavescens]MDX6749741.1 MerR family DNA-binding transcriptional regulator [Geminicoccaceae bacterium 1502E]
MRDGLTIGAVARRGGVSVETVRYYERIGLLPPPPRSAGGHRLYGEEDARRLDFVRRGRALGFGLEEIRRLLRLEAGGCGEAQLLAREQLASLRRKMAELRRMERALAGAAAGCSASRAAGCPLLRTLSGG